ncbi:MAG: tetratricopeptide repeat protein [Acidobacteriaceae bacterium]
MRFKVISVLAIAMLLAWPRIAGAQDHPGDFADVAAAASSAREQGDIAKAISMYQEAVRLNPNWPDGWWYLGTLDYGSNAYAPAIDALTHYIELTPKGGPAYALRGLCEFEAGEYPSALNDLERGIALGAANQPRNSQIIFYHEALLLTKLGRYEEALGKYALMVKHGTFDEDIANGIGLAGLRLPILPAEIDPGQAQLIANVGTAAASVMRGDMDDGQRKFQAIFASHPRAPYLHYLYGYLLSVAAPEQAIAQFQKELTISPNSAIAHSMLAWCLGTEGDFRAALPNAEKSAQEDPSLLMGQLVLGRDLVETGDWNGALPHLEAVLKSDTKNLEAHLALAKAYSELGRKDDARRERLLCLSLSKHGAANANL